MNFRFLATLGAVGLITGASGAQNRVLSTDITNIAASANGGRVIAVTSTFGNDKNYTAQNLIDGKIWRADTPNSSRGWVSDKFDPIDMDSVTLGFAGNRQVKIGRIVLNAANDQTPERWAKDVEIQVSTETAEGPFEPVAQLTLAQNSLPQSFDILPSTARFVKVVIRTNYGSDRAAALGEVEIYEAIDDSDPLGALITRYEGALKELETYRTERMENGATPASASANSNRPRLQNVQLAGTTGAGRTNIAATKNGGKIVAYSSSYNNDAAFGPEKLIDGEVWREADQVGSNGWASNQFAPGKEYVTLGWGGNTRLIDRFVLNPSSNQSDLRWARRVEVQVSTGDFKSGPWKTVSTLNLKPSATNQEFSIRPTEAKYVRFVFRANGPGIVLPGADPDVNSDRAVSLGEIEIYEAAAPDDKLDSVIGRLKQVLVDMKTLRRRQIDAENAPLTPTPARLNPARKTPAKKPVATQTQKKNEPVTG